MLKTFGQSTRTRQVSLALAAVWEGFDRNGAVVLLYAERRQRFQTNEGLAVVGAVIIRTFEQERERKPVAQQHVNPHRR